MDYIRTIQTTTGPKKIDYTALANLPDSDMTLSKQGGFADALVVGQKFIQLTNQIKTLTDTISELQNRITALESKD